MHGVGRPHRRTNRRRGSIASILCDVCLQEIEDRKRIQQLLGAGSAGMPGRAPSAKPQPALAHYSVDALLLKIESLQAQLNEQVQHPICLFQNTAKSRTYYKLNNIAPLSLLAESQYSLLCGAEAQWCHFHGTPSNS